MSNQELLTETANAVESTRKRAGRTKRWLSDETGIPYPTLNRKVAAKTEFTFTELFKIAEALGVSPAEFTPIAFTRTVRTDGKAA